MSAATARQPGALGYGWPTTRPGHAIPWTPAATVPLPSCSPTSRAAPGCGSRSPPGCEPRWRITTLLCRATVEAHARHSGQDDRRRHVRGVRRSVGCRCAPRSRCKRPSPIRRSPRASRAQGPLRAACGRRRAPRQRLLRHRRQPHRAHHERRARRPGAAVEGRCRSSSAGSLAGRRRAARPRRGAAARSRQSRARLPARAPRAAAELPGAALARSDAQQPAAAGHVVRRPRAAAGRDQAPCSARRDC